MNREDDPFLGCFGLIFGVGLLLAIAVVGTAIYLALKNWG